jgi:hypothetical protein
MTEEAAQVSDSSTKMITASNARTTGKRAGGASDDNARLQRRVAIRAN